MVYGDSLQSQVTASLGKQMQSCYHLWEEPCHKRISILLLLQGIMTMLCSHKFWIIEVNLGLLSGTINIILDWKLFVSLRHECILSESHWGIVCHCLDYLYLFRPFHDFMCICLSEILHWNWLDKGDSVLFTKFFIHHGEPWPTKNFQSNWSKNHLLM